MNTPAAGPALTVENPPAAPGNLVTCRPATSDGELAEHHAIRHAVFVAEQQVFDASDRDAYDDTPTAVYLLGRYAGIPVGAVRLYPVGPESSVWQGDRLCVLPEYRTHGVATPLVHCAVAVAGARGGTRMVAHVQLPNVAFFTSLGWQVEGDTETYVGLAHQPMSIALPEPAAATAIARELFAGVRC